MILEKEEIPLARSETSEKNPSEFFCKANTKNSGSQGGVKSAGAWKPNCFLKLAFFIVFFTNVMKNYHYLDKGLLIFLMRCAAMTGQTVPLETDQSLVSLCPFNHSILGLLALCSSTELGQPAGSYPMWREFYAQTRTRVVSLITGCRQPSLFQAASQTPGRHQS